MISIPFVYFSILSLFLYKRNKKKLDFAVMITAMFALSGLFSILVDFFGYRNFDTVNYKISIVASFSYCALITLCVLPFVVHSNLKINNIRPLKNSGLLKIFAFLSMIWLLLLVIFSWSTFKQILFSNLGETRAQVYAGDIESSLQGVPRVVRPVMIILNSIFSCSWILIFFAFISRYVQRLPRKYFWMYLFSSFAGPYNAVFGADRSAVAYWLLIAAGIFLLFRPFISNSDKKRLIRISLFIGPALVVYLAVTTISRFDDTSTFGNDSGILGSLFYYFGISYINFCNFFDNYTPPFSNLGIIFPFTAKFLFGIETGGVIIQQQMTLATGMECGTFYTFIGQIMMGAGRSIAIIYCFIYTFISFLVIPSITKKSGTNIFNLFLYFALISVIYLGLFGYYYVSPYKTFSLFFFFFLLRLTK